MSSFGESLYGGTIRCHKIIATEADLPSSGGGGGVIDVSGVNFDNKWSITLDSNDNLLLTNDMVNVVGLSGDAHTGKITLYDFNLEDLADVNPDPVKEFGSVMWYESINQTYNFTDSLRYLLVSWNISGIPFVFSNGDLRVLNDHTTDTGSSNIIVGGYQRITPTANGGSVLIGHESGQTSNEKYNVAIGYHAGKINQGKGFGFFTGNSVAIGYQAGEFNQESNSIAIGNDAGAYNQETSALALGFNAGYNDQSSNAISIGSFSGNFNQEAGAVAIGTSTGRNNQGSNSVAIGIDCAILNQGSNSVALGQFSGEQLQQSECIAIGHLAARNNQQVNSVAIGHKAGNSTQGAQSVAIGHNAGDLNQSANSVAIGHNAGVTSQLDQAVAIGNQSGFTGQAEESVAIGNRAGRTNLGPSSVAIGDRAANDGGSHAKTIVINGTGANLNPAGTNRTYIKPIRSLVQNETLHYDDGTGEITRNANVSIAQGTGVTVTGTYPAFTISSSAPVVVQGATEGYLNTFYTQLTNTGRNNARDFNGLGSSWVFNTTGSAVVAATSSDGLIRFNVAGVYSITLGFLSVSNPTSRGRYVYAKYRSGSSGAWTDYKSSHFVDGQAPQVSDFFYQATVTTTFLYTADALDEITFDLRFDYVNTAGYVFGHWPGNNMWRETFINAHKVA